MRTCSFFNLVYLGGIYARGRGGGQRPPPYIGVTYAWVRVEGHRPPPALPQHSPDASTVSFPPLLINSLSFPKSPLSLDSPSSSALASASASDLPQLTPPSRRRSTYCRGRQVQNMVTVTRIGGSAGRGRCPPTRTHAYVPPM